MSERTHLVSADCLRCAEKDARIAWLESELGLRLETDRYAVLRQAMRLATTHGWCAARFVDTLYAARGRAMTLEQIMDGMPPKAGGDDERDTRIVAVWVCRARKALGRDAIENVWGKGYRLTPLGMSRVAEMLSPTAEAA
jgi:DNA-binding response OmpR family regulator